MAAIGFEGISVETKSTRELMAPLIGFKGVSFQLTKQQYFEPKNGFKSISLTYDIGGFAKKIWHLK